MATSAVSATRDRQWTAAIRRRLHAQDRRCAPANRGALAAGVKVGEHSLVRIRCPRRIRAERDIEDRRVCPAGSQQRRRISGKGQIVGPDKCQPIVKSLELALELAMPELAELSGPHHHEHLPGLGPQLQDVVDGRESRLSTATAVSLSPSGASSRNRRSTDANSSGVSGKSCCRYLRANIAAGPAAVTIRSGFGRSSEGGSDVVDHHLFWRADKPRWPHHDLHDVHGLRRAPHQFDTEVVGELVNRDRAAVEGLQHQHLADHRLGLARCRAEQNHDREQARRYHPWKSSTRAGFVHDAE